MKNSAVLLIDCPDQKGLVAGIANFLLELDANILHADQHQDADRNLFFMRVEWDLEGFDLELKDFAQRFEPIAKKFKMRWRLHDGRQAPRVALFVSKYDHCLVDVLYRHRAGDIPADIVAIVSNHPDVRPIAEFYQIPFHVLPVTPEKKIDAEKKQLKLLSDLKVELVVLARYMQILSPAFVAAYPLKIINVHHSFLPAFVGARPYHQAYERGVKLIGATSHYVTEVLDDGPIIEQDVVRISHRDQVEDLVKKGGDLEKSVLSRALRWHVDARILVYGNKTVVFD